MKKKKEKVTYIDDGRTIANMNVEGMPWYNPAKNAPVEGLPESKAPKYEPNAKETLAIMGGILKAAMLVAVIFIVVFLLFILFCQFVWLK